jgi:hypothetical protein
MESHAVTNSGFIALLLRRVYYLDGRRGMTYMTNITYISGDGAAMFANKSRVLLILPQEVLDRARAYAGRATSTLKLAVSLQIVLRALIEEGLKREGSPALLSNIDAQARAVRRTRGAARRVGRRNGPK